MLLENKTGYPYHKLGLFNLAIFKYERDDMENERNMLLPLVLPKQGDLITQPTWVVSHQMWAPTGHIEERYSRTSRWNCPSSKQLLLTLCGCARGGGKVGGEMQ